MAHLIIDDKIKTNNNEIRRMTGITTIMQDEYSTHKFQYFIVFFILGLMNNAGFVVVNTASADLATKFDRENLMPAFLFALNIMAIIVK